MTLVHFEANRQRIAELLEIEQRQQRMRIGITSEMPPDFYNPREMEVFQRGDALIMLAARNFLTEQGLETLTLEKEFLREARDLPGGLHYRLNGTSGPIGAESARMRYVVAERVDMSFVALVRQTPIPVPEGWGKNTQINVDDALSLLRRGQAFRLARPMICSEVTTQGIEGMLTLMLSNPANAVPLRGRTQGYERI